MIKTKSFVIAFALLCLSAGAYAQAELSLGLKGGVNLANLDTENSLGGNYKNRTGFHVGAFGLIKLTKIGIQPELIFSQQGSKLEYQGEDLESNFSYLNVPIMVKLYTIAGINLQAGPQFGFVMNAEQETINELTGNKTTQDIKDDLKGSDISLGLGAGWDLPFGLTVDARYNLGLSKINDKSASNEAKNQVWQFSIGYKFIKLGK